MPPPASKFSQQFFFTFVCHPCHPHLVTNKSSTKLMPHNCILHQGSVRIGRLVKQLKLSDRLWFWEGVGHAVSAVESWAGNWFEHRFGWDSEMHGPKILSQEGCACICNCMFACIHEAFYCLLVLCQFCLWRCAGWMCISMITWWRRNLQASAKAFLNECKVSSDPVGMLHTSSCCVAMAIFT